MPPREVLGPSRGLGWLAAACAAAVAGVLALDRPHLPTAITIATLLVQGAGLLALAIVARRGEPRPIHSVALVAIAAGNGVTGYFFGPLSAFAAALALVLVLAGLATDPPAMPRALGRAIYAAIAGSHLAVFALVMSGALAERSLVPVRVPGHPDWHGWMAELALQGIFAGAYVAGLAAARRYRRLSDEIDASTRDVARQDALLAEARADYARAVEIARQGAVAPEGPRDLGRAATSDEPASSTLEQASAITVEDRPSTPPPAAPIEPRAPSEWGDPARVSAWDAAYLQKMRYQDAAALILCAVGATLLVLVTPSPLPRDVALVSFLAIAATFMVRRWMLRRNPGSAAYGPWLVVAVLGAGPTYAWGVHSGIQAVNASLLFAGGLFRAPRSRQRDRVVVVITLMAAQAVMFGLIAAGVLPDESTLPVFLPRATAREPYVAHALTQLTLAVAFIAGTMVDRRIADAFRRADVAHHEVLRREAMLRQTRVEIDEALRKVGGGLFTGTTIGEHAVGRLLGRGGMGEVYEAIDPIGVRVALKLLRVDRAGDPASLARFLAEGEVLGRVESPFVARVLAVGGDPGELPFIAMSYVDGRSLAAVLRERERLTPAGVASMIRDLGRGLQDVHEAGFLHLDVKPSNIMLTDEEAGSRWCLVDFGVARLARGGDASIAGTPQYMAPEQAEGGPVDARADLYSLCLVVYRALTGRPAFAGADPQALAAAARRGPPDPRPLAAIHDDVALALRIGLAPDPADRWQSAFDLRVAFDRAFAGALLDEDRVRALDLLARSPWA